MGVFVVFEDGSDAVAVVPGEQAACVVRVENTGMVVDRVLLDVLGEAAAWASVEPAQVNLLPGAVERIRITFQPPRAASLAPGELGFGLRAMSTEDPEGSCIEEGTVRVGEFAELGAHLVPTNATGRRSARFRLVVENRGNRPEQVRIEGHDPEVKLGFRTRPAVFTARPGTATFVRLKTVPRKTFLKGPNRTLPFEVSALPERGEAAKAEGVMLEKQTLPEWLLPVLGIAVAACGLMFALWMTVLQPVVHSAASAAAQAQNAASSAKSAAKAMATAKPTKAARPAPPTALAVKLASPTVVMGTTDPATATGTFADGAGAVPALVWTSSAPHVASVSPSGVVTALSPGTATITATGTTSTASPASGTPGASASPSAGAPRPGPGAATPSPTPAAPAVLSGSVTVNVVGPVSVTTATLPEGVLGKPYSVPLGGAGGTGSYTWSVSSGQLPPGLSLAAQTGAVTGTPTTPGTSTFAVHLADPGPPSQSAAKTYQVTVRSALAVDNSSLPGATTGTAYTQTLMAVGGTAPYSWSLVPGQGGLPGGMSLNPATGAISGTPDLADGYGVTVQVTDSASPRQSATQHLTLTVAKPLLINTLTLPDAVTDTPYAQTLTAFGGTQPYTWSVSSGSLPAGLTLGSTSGVLSGTPRNDGSSTFTVRATDSGKPALTSSQVFTVEAVTGFSATVSSVSQGAIGLPYTTQLTAAGGSAPYVWTLTGTLPAGLSLAPNGAITGTPTATGSFPFSVQATDSSAPPLTTDESLTLTVVGSLKITTVSLPHALTGQPYSEVLTAIGGTPPYTWSSGASTLPDGLSLNPATGVISGTPVSTGTVPLDISVADSGPPAQTASLTTTMTVVEPLSFQEPAIPEAAVGFPYAGVVPIDVDGGSGHESWSVTDGALPTGLKVDSATGAITGEATSSAGTYEFTLTVSDATDFAVTAKTQLAITVVNPLTVPGSYTWSGTVGTAFQGTVQPSAGVAPYTFTLGGGAPGWMSVSPSTGVVTGTPDGPCTGETSTDLPSSGSEQTVQTSCAADTFDGEQVMVTDALGESAITTLNLTAAVPPLTVEFNTATPTQTGGTPLKGFATTVGTPAGGYGGAVYTYSATGLPCDTSGTCDQIDPGTGVVSGDLGHLAAGTPDFTVTVTATDPEDGQNTIIVHYRESITTQPAPAPSPSPTSPTAAPTTTSGGTA
ncbi:hypothetical protein GXW83_22300 [Streptacidiphilus sp. PB12-B1b]|uniref:Ig domain-containing protein n=1 Tax=Streptacidiphilus sp. PB12-B1b TaxID=2705012 RepID=UPI0015FA27CB|nr:Ig domain-containing protein [Streptacidiphilus sp. PB12-B1b]QMU78021.1 hypothetical protein GXW83_22300 [Streptacidiphilus sp. PB12-B1b]